MVGILMHFSSALFATLYPGRRRQPPLASFYTKVATRLFFVLVRCLCPVSVEKIGVVPNGHNVLITGVSVAMVGADHTARVLGGWVYE